MNTTYAEPTPQLLTVRQVAACCNLSHRQIWNWIWSGKLPHVRFGRSVRVDVNALRELIEESTDRKPKA